MESNIMFAEERKEKILNIAKKNQKVVVPELSELFNVSPATIRNDLNELEKEGKLKRTHGGAIYNKHIGYELKSEEKKVKNVEGKMKIAKAAFELIEDGDIILIDTGTTTYQLAKLLKDTKSVTVVTNDIEIAFMMEEYENIELILIGGDLRKGFHCAVGAFATQILSSIYVDKAFIGANTYSSEGGVATPNASQSENKAVMMKSAAKNYLLIDSRKFGERSFVKFADGSDFDMIITDDGLDEKYVSEFKGTNLFICKE
ncbi:MAG: DeoR/GlpR family DNA-binding transcription regulator [Clostridia bacterium]|nr:DeoR/GlpR family DNA-binding transcription regulator [Clostridia bacterium]